MRSNLLAACLLVALASAGACAPDGGGDPDLDDFATAESAVRPQEVLVTYWDVDSQGRMIDVGAKLYPCHGSATSTGRKTPHFTKDVETCHDHVIVTAQCFNWYLDTCEVRRDGGVGDIPESCLPGSPGAREVPCPLNPSNW